MAAARPFASVEAIVESADRIWWGLDAADWREAFAAHPRIGENSAPSESESAKSAFEHPEARVARAGEAWSAEEQSSVRHAGTRVRARLAVATREYEARFGYIFIVCATGKSAEEMLAILESRLRNDLDHEMMIAAEEQRKISHLRIAKLLGESSSTTAREQTE